MVALTDTDVFVVGGGPAGLAAAIAARLRGFRVLLADCFHPPIDKACGEGLMPDSAAVLRALGVDLDGVTAGTFRGIRFLSAEHSATAKFPAGSGIGIRRTVLHERLLHRAREVGVEMRWGARVCEVRDSAVLMDGETARFRWLIGADGQNSQVRCWAGLSTGREHVRRIGLRQHFRIAPWSEFVEVYWGDAGQMYVTPVGEEEIGVALLARKRVASFDAALENFGLLAQRLRGAARSTAVKGAATVSRRLRSVCSGHVALVGDASGSVDAITGDGLAISFHQSLALADALGNNDLGRYQAAHRRIMARPHLIGRLLLLMDGNAWLRRRALRALAGNPTLFERLVALHVGSLNVAEFGMSGAADLGWELLKPTCESRVPNLEQAGSRSGLGTRNYGCPRG